MHDYMIHLHLKEMDWVYWVQELRSPVWDAVFRILSFFDTHLFELLLVVALWIGYHWRIGIRVLYLLVLNMVLNALLKDLFEQPRPFNLDPSVGLISTNTYGFPSGAAQLAVLLSALLLQSFGRRWWAWLAALNVFFWLSLSRIYLGAHFPTDLLGGWLAGLCLWAFYVFARPRCERFCARQSFAVLIGLGILIPIVIGLPLLLTKHFVPGSYRLVTFLISLNISTCVALRWGKTLEEAPTVREFLLRAAYGMAGLFVIEFLIGFLLVEVNMTRSLLGQVLDGVWIGMAATWSWQIMLYRLYGSRSVDKPSSSPSAEVGGTIR